MKTLRITTKKGFQAAIIDDSITVVKENNGFVYYNNIAKGQPNPDQSDAEEFVNFYLQKKEEEKQAIERKKQAAIDDERKRIEELIEEAKKCDYPRDLAEFFDIPYLAVANHWNELYNGNCKGGFIFTSAEQYRDFDLIRKELNISGDYVELEHRDGEHHYTPSTVFDLENYQENCKSYLSEKFNWKSKDTEEEYFLKRIKEATSMEEVGELVKEFDEIEDGYYSNGDSLVLAGEVDENFLGYYFDVYSYAFGFVFESEHRRLIEDEEE